MIHKQYKQVEKNGKGCSFDVLRAKVLYGTKAILKKPKYSDEVDFRRFENKWSNRFESLKGVELL